MIGSNTDLKIVLTAVDNASTILKGVGKSIKNTSDKIKSATKTAGEFGDKLKKIGATTAMFAGAGLTALTTQSVVMEGSFKQLKNQIGATDKEMAVLKRTSKDIFAQGLGENIEEVNKGLSFFKREMGLVGDELKEANIGALTIAKTFDKDLIETARQTTSIMKNYGITAKEANALTFSSLQQVGDGYDDLLDTAQEYSGQFAKAGFNAKEMFNILIQGNKDGVYNIDKVGDAVKEFGVRIVDGSKGTKEAFELMGLSYDDFRFDLEHGNTTIKDSLALVNKEIAATEDPIYRNQLGVAMYGTQWEDVGEKAIFNLSNIQDSLSGTEGNIATATQSLDKGFNTALRKINGTLLEVVEPLKEMVIKISKWVSENSELVKTITLISVGVIAVVSTLGVLGIAITAVSSGIAAISTIIAVATTIVQGLGAAFMFLSANPIGLLITAVVALGVVVYKFYKNWDDITLTIKYLTKKMTESVINSWNKLKSGVSKILESISKWFSEKWTAIKNTVKTVMDFLGNLFKSAFAIQINIIRGAFNIIKALFTGDFAYIKNVVINTFQNIKNTISSLLGSAKNIAINAFNGMKNGIVGVASSIYNGVVSKFQAMINFVKNIFGQVTAIGNKITAIKGKATRAANNIKSAWKNAGANIKYLYNAKVNGAREIGGPVARNKTYLVGENGPEYFTPGTSGQITSNNNTGGGQPINITFGDVHLNNGQDTEDFFDRVKKVMIEVQRNTNNGYA